MKGGNKYWRRTRDAGRFDGGLSVVDDEGIQPHLAQADWPLCGAVWRPWPIPSAPALLITTSTCWHNEVL